MNSEVDIKVVQSGRDRRRFIELPWMIYKNDPNWIPPLVSDMRNTLEPGKNALLRLGPNRFYIALRDGVVVGRINVGKDNKVYRVYQMPL